MKRDVLGQWSLRQQEDKGSQAYVCLRQGPLRNTGMRKETPGSLCVDPASTGPDELEV